MPQVERVSRRPNKLLFIGAGILIGLVTMVVILNGAQKPKGPVATPLPTSLVPAAKYYYPPVDAGDIRRAHETLVLEGVVQSVDGIAMKFIANGSKQTLSLTIVSATTYSKGKNYTPSDKASLKAGSHASVTYNSRTNEVLKVAYDL